MVEEKMMVIGIVENSQERNTFKLLKEMFSISSYEVVYENKAESMVILNQDNNHIMILDIEPENADSIEGIGIDFNILIHTFLKSVDYDNENIKNMFGKSKYIIVNSDEERWTTLLDNNVESIAISYGFNNKATINPSSYNIHEVIEANISFQRTIYTVLGEEIDPFELPIKINSRNKAELYSGMAIMACSLILGMDLCLLNEVVEFKSRYMRRI